MSDSKPKHILVVGAGLCGTLLAIRLAQLGFKVTLTEKRQDLRYADISAGRSINLALSDRGFKALRMVGLEEEVRQAVIPMRARLMHDRHGNKHLSPYSGRERDYINSVSRTQLNAILLYKAASMPNIDMHFETSCIHVDIDNKRAFFKDANTGEESSRTADLIIGTDGAGSPLRRSIFRHSTRFLFNYEQKFLRHGYKELSILPNPDGSHKIEDNVLHIWPRGSFMLIALPNLDGSFTVTCFFPFAGENGFDNLKTPEDVTAFFKREFPDALEHMPHLSTEFFENPTGTLGTIKCYPWHIGEEFLILGDASHAIVPFYGQGMNAAFEDVYVFDQYIADANGDIGAAMERMSEERKIDTDAIADLAIDNFYEMRDHVAIPNFVLKRDVERRLEQTYPDYYSKYSLVTFQEDLPYHQAMNQGRAQDEFLLDYCSKYTSIEQIVLEDVYNKVMALNHGK